MANWPIVRQGPGSKAGWQRESCKYGTVVAQRRHRLARHARRMGHSVMSTTNDTSSRGACAICGRLSSCRVFFMTHGVRVSLCIVHRHGNYLRRDGGRRFVNDLRVHWRQIHGTIRPWCELAAKAHLLRVTGRASTDGPGSYSWDGLRFEAEARFAAGDDPKRVIAGLRASNAGGPARVPSARTMRRWFFEGRWLVDPRRQARRMSRGRTPRFRNREVDVETSDLGMCIFRPTLAWALGINLGDAVRDATAKGKARLAHVLAQQRC